jgi:hypothetical protein
MIMANQGIEKVILPNDVLIPSLASKEQHYLSFQTIYGYAALRKHGGNWMIEEGKLI